jgi:hypothetical protein
MMMGTPSATIKKVDSAAAAASGHEDILHGLDAGRDSQIRAEVDCCRHLLSFSLVDWSTWGIRAT